MNDKNHEEPAEKWLRRLWNAFCVAVIFIAVLAAAVYVSQL